MLMFPSAGYDSTMAYDVGDKCRECKHHRNVHGPAWSLPVGPCRRPQCNCRMFVEPVRRVPHEEGDLAYKPGGDKDPWTIRERERQAAADRAAARRRK